MKQNYRDGKLRAQGLHVWKTQNQHGITTSINHINVIPVYSRYALKHAKQEYGQKKFGRNNKNKNSPLWHDTAQKIMREKIMREVMIKIMEELVENADHYVLIANNKKSPRNFEPDT